MPMTPFIGVRISWLIMARNWLFARFADSAASLADCNSAAWRLSAEMSIKVVSDCRWPVTGST
jgi:hypothetical protein